MSEHKDFAAWLEAKKDERLTKSVDGDDPISRHMRGEITSGEFHEMMKSYDDDEPSGGEWIAARHREGGDPYVSEYDEPNELEVEAFLQVFPGVRTMTEAERYQFAKMLDENPEIFFDKLEKMTATADVTATATGDRRFYSRTVIDLGEKH